VPPPSPNSESAKPYRQVVRAYRAPLPPHRDLQTERAFWAKKRRRLGVATTPPHASPSAFCVVRYGRLADRAGDAVRRLRRRASCACACGVQNGRERRSADLHPPRWCSPTRHIPPERRASRPTCYKTLIFSLEAVSHVSTLGPVEPRWRQRAERRNHLASTSTLRLFRGRRRGVCRAPLQRWHHVAPVSSHWGCGVRGARPFASPQFFSRE
jgi:hypothetical protein